LTPWWHGRSLLCCLIIAAVCGLAVLWLQFQDICGLSLDSGLLLDSVVSGSCEIMTTTTWTTTRTWTCQNSTILPVAGIYVIGMNSSSERYQRFRENFVQMCGVERERVQHHAGVVATEKLLTKPWVRVLVPALTAESARRLGSMGLALAHLSAWDRARRSTKCTSANATNKYILIFEDDEQPKPGIFTDVVMRLVEYIQALEADELRPDFINLNTHRSLGAEVVAFQDLPETVSVLRVEREHRKTATGPVNSQNLQYNVWMSAYMVRCGSLDALIHHGGQYPGGTTPYDGVSPTFDRHMSDVLSDPTTSLLAYVLAPEDAISVHKEAVDDRKARDRASEEEERHRKRKAAQRKAKLEEEEAKRKRVKQETHQKEEKLPKQEGGRESKSIQQKAKVDKKKRV